MHIVLLLLVAAVAPFLVAANLWRLLARRPLTRGIGRVEATSLVLGPPSTALLFVFFEWPEWDEPVQLSLGLDDRHTALAAEHRPVVLALAGLALVGYALLRQIGLGLPPLLAAASYAAVLAGCALAVAWTVQLLGHGLPAESVAWWLHPLVVLFPLDFLVYSARLTRALLRGEDVGAPLRAGDDAVAGATPTPDAPPAERRTPRSHLLAWARRTLADARRIPLVGFVLLWPLTGVAILVLLLLGQQPDAAVRAFTETADWALSTKVGPPPVPGPDNHYLCTVAAGGHPRLVRPLRTGVRHGRRITVNRQLLVANAFEDLVASRWPSGHRAIRAAYDRHGYPLSRRITTRASADVVYVLMKPLEWAFLAVLYACDRRPEDRIARQYLPGAPAAR